MCENKKSVLCAFLNLPNNFKNIYFFFFSVLINSIFQGFFQLKQLINKKEKINQNYIEAERRENKIQQKKIFNKYKLEMKRHDISESQKNLKNYKVD